MVTRRSHGPTSYLQHGHQKMSWASLLPSTWSPKDVMGQPSTFNMATKKCVGQPPTFNTVTKRCCGPTSYLPHGHKEISRANLLPSTWSPKDVVGQLPTFNMSTRTCGPTSYLQYGHQNMCRPTSHLPRVLQKMLWANLPPSTWPPEDVVGQPPVFGQPDVIPQNITGQLLTLAKPGVVLPETLQTNLQPPSSSPEDGMGQPTTISPQNVVGQPPTFTIVFPRRWHRTTSYLEST